MSHVVLFLCVANSARSQLAEGLARVLVPAGIEVHSAGSMPAELHPMTIRVLAEQGIDTVGQYSKGLDRVPLERVSTVITLCDEEVCPTLPAGAVRLHWPLPDPAGAQGGAADELESFRRVRDLITDRLRDWLAAPGTSAIA